MIFILIYLSKSSTDNINICCEGESSCHESRLYLKSNGNTIYCDDKSCSYETICSNYGNNIFIRGSASKKYMTMHNFSRLVTGLQDYIHNHCNSSVRNYEGEEGVATST